MVYLAKKDGVVVHHTCLTALKEMDGIDKPDMQISEAEWEAAEGIARIVNGKKVLGKSKAEKTAESNRRRIEEIDSELDDIDRKSIRPERSVAHALARGETPPAQDVARLDELENRVNALRTERASLNTGVAG
jgi:hypothetical protein